MEEREARWMLRRAAGDHPRRWLPALAAASHVAPRGTSAARPDADLASSSRVHAARVMSTASTQGRRPCYGGDNASHLGLPFKLTAEDAQNALRKWTG